MAKRNIYLDWNAAAPLHPAAREAMIAAMDVIGNPSSVHEGGRQAKKLIDAARDDIAALAGCDPSEVIFTSGATEASNSVLRSGGWSNIFIAPIEHDAVSVAAEYSSANLLNAAVSRNGQIDRRALISFMQAKASDRSLLCVQAANSETGVLQDIAGLAEAAASFDIPVFVDAAQVFGKFRDGTALFDFAALGIDYAALAAEKVGGPAGVGALIVKDSASLPPLIVGGGQELKRRAGTENVVGICGMGAAARAALENRDQSHVAEMTDSARTILQSIARDYVDVGAGSPRLANTLCFAIPGWKGSTQMMQLDLAGYAVSAGSACSSGKVNESRAVREMGYDRITAASTLRVSLGASTTEAEVAGFIDAWSGLYRDREAKRHAG